MKILVNSTAMDARGAFSVMDSFLKEMNLHYEDFRKNGIKMLFLAGNEKLCIYKNDLLDVEFNSYPKKSWYHKWKYERIIVPELFRKNNFDVYLSMQNYVLKNIDKKQFVLMHQPIPFSDLKFSDLELMNWLKYSVIFKYLLKKQKDRVNGAIVQTAWMKKALIEKYQYSCPVRIIRPPVADIKNNTQPLTAGLAKLFETDEVKILYPTNLEKYKNNERLIKAVNLHNSNDGKKVILYLTIPGISTHYIRYINKIPYESILTLYRSIDAVIFPSLTETLGLPLLEAQFANVPVLAANLPYARELCGDNCIYFEPKDIHSIAGAIKSFTEKNETFEFNTNPIMDSYFDYINFIRETLT